MLLRSTQLRLSCRTTIIHADLTVARQRSGDPTLVLETTRQDFVVQGDNTQDRGSRSGRPALSLCNITSDCRVEVYFLT